jgi:hypothetical protein
VERNDPAAAKALVDTGQIDMTVGGGNRCTPARSLFERASKWAPKFITMADVIHYLCRQGLVFLQGPCLPPLGDLLEDSAARCDVPS